MDLMRRIRFGKFGAEEEAATSVEYALMVGLIAMAIFGAVTLFGSAVATKLFGNAVTKLPF